MIMTAKVIETEDIDEENEVSSAEDVEASDEGSNEDNTAGVLNPQWADSISKILRTNKPKGKKTLVLSKAKKLTDVKTSKTKPVGFQVATADGEVKDEKIEVEEVKSEEPTRKKKRELPNLRVKPNILDKDRERTLSKIATKGVVQLFNTVKLQQKDISKKLEEAGPLDVKKDKVLKSIDKKAFLDVLMGEKSQIVDKVADESSKQKDNKTDNESTWSVLRDDFMMGAKLKDWDKEVETEKETAMEFE